MKANDQDTLLRMIGTQGVLELESVTKLLPKDHSFRDPFALACHLLNVGLDRCKLAMERELGICELREKTQS